jgi:hypothetical protein
MSMIIREGQPPLPVLYTDWAEWKALRREGCEEVPASATTIVFCPTCWGNGRYLEPAANGEGLVPQTCPACDGSGIVVT